MEVEGRKLDFKMLNRLNYIASKKILKYAIDEYDYFPCFWATEFASDMDVQEVGLFAFLQKIEKIIFKKVDYHYIIWIFSDLFLDMESEINIRINILCQFFDILGGFHF